MSESTKGKDEKVKKVKKIRSVRFLVPANRSGKSVPGNGPGNGFIHRIVPKNKPENYSGMQYPYRTEGSGEDKIEKPGFIGPLGPPEPPYATEEDELASKEEIPGCADTLGQGEISPRREKPKPEQPIPIGTGKGPLVSPRRKNIGKDNDIWGIRERTFGEDKGRRNPRPAKKMEIAPKNNELWGGPEDVQGPGPWPGPGEKTERVNPKPPKKTNIAPKNNDLFGVEED